MGQMSIDEPLGADRSAHRTRAGRAVGTPRVLGAQRVRRMSPSAASGAMAAGRGCEAMTNGDVAWIANFVQNIADDVLRDLYVRGK